MSFRIFRFKGSPGALFYRNYLWKRCILPNQGDKITSPGANAKRKKKELKILIYTGLALRLQEILSTKVVQKSDILLILSDLQKQSLLVCTSTLSECIFSTADFYCKSGKSH